MATPLDFGPVQQLVELLRGAGLRADVDPTELNLPGAWVNVEGVTTLTLGGALQLEVAVYLIAEDADYARALDRLAALYNAMAPVLLPDGRVVPQGVVMPGSTTALPALRVPVNLYSSTD